MGFWNKFWSKITVIRPDFDYATSVNRAFNETDDIISTVLTCEKILSESLAKLPLEIYRQTDEGRMKDKEHNLYKILHKYPNAWTNSTIFFSTLEKHRNHYGNAFALINRENRSAKPTSLQIIHPNKVRGYKIMGGELFYIFHDHEPISSENVLHFKFISDDGVYGINPIKALLFELDNIFQGKTTLNKAYKNNLNIDKYLQSSISNFNAKNVKDNLEEWKSQYRGSNGTKETPILPSGWDLKAAPTSSIQDAQILESLNFNKKDVAALYGVPSYMIGMDVANISIEQMGLQFKTNTLQYIARMYRQEMERKLLFDREHELSIEFNLDALVEVDYSTKVAGTINQVKAGLMTPNEANKILGNAMFENGKYHFVQMQSATPLEKLDEFLPQLMAKNANIKQENNVG